MHKFSCFQISAWHVPDVLHSLWYEEEWIIIHFVFFLHSHHIKETEPAWSFARDYQIYSTKTAVCFRDQVPP